MSNIIRLTEGQAKEAVIMLARAFHNYPQFDYTLPNLKERAQKLPEIKEFMVRYGIMYGEVYSNSENLEGIAVWLPYWKTEVTRETAEKCGGNELYLSLGKEYYKRYKPIGDCENRCHRQYADFFHWYLYPIGVDPIHQGKGYAGQLLRAKLAEVDKQNVPCYLETNKEKNVSLYEHFGFEIVEEGIVPDTEVSYWAMLRKTP
ncbi:MAG: GNAT family N-acetyltransferase [Candidatus Lokiarchaeota archaeon]|nr:GNAT family N-acetyltransferase [Candidatus Lokiarchaeota archaeon]